MSQAPEAKPEEASEAAAYGHAWGAINKLIRRGHSWSGHERNCAFLNTGDGRFANISGVSGFDFADDGRALATVDFDLDGRIDVLVSNRTTPRVRLLRGGGAARSLSLRLRGAGGNRNAIGARVEVVTSGVDEGTTTTITRAVRAGEGYLAQSSAWLSFGLQGQRVEHVVVHWPAGEREVFTDFATNEWTFVLEQGQGRPERFVRASAKHALVARAESASDEDPASPAPYGNRIVLATPLPLPVLAIEPIGAPPVSLFGVRPGGEGTGTGRTVLLNVWSSTCAPCVGELSEYTARAEDLDASGLAFLALCTDDASDEAQRVMERVEWPYAWAFVPPLTIEILDVLFGVVLDTQQRLPLPTSFLVDAAGLVRIVYTGRVAPDQLLRDAQLLADPSAAWSDHALPFAGIWHRRPTSDLAALERRFAKRGLADTAREFARTAFEVVTRSRAELLHEFGREYAAQGNFDGAIDAFRSAIEADPDYFAARFDLGILLQRKGESHEAISAYVNALRIEPDHIDAHFNLALAYLKTRQILSAERHHRRLTDLGSALADQLVPFLDKLRAETDER